MMVVLAKSQSAREASLQPAFMSGCLAINQMYLPCLLSERRLLFWRCLFVVGRQVNWDRWEISELGRWERCMTGVKQQGEKVVWVEWGESAPATSHYPESTDMYSPQYGRLSFSLHFMIHIAFLLSFSHFCILPESQGHARPVHATIPGPTDRFSVNPFPPSLSHSPNLGCVRAQRIMFLGRFLV